jgi:pimeloyl-ACP methyl ester carboxylesterase
MCGVVALAPVADLRMAYELNLSDGAVVEFLGATPQQNPGIYDAACPARHATQAPAVILHGTSDDVVPIALSRSYMNMRGQDPAGVRLMEMPGVDHFALIDPQSQSWPAVVDCVLALIGER